MPQITLLTGPERRRRWSDDERQRILAAAFTPGAVVSTIFDDYISIYISRQFKVSTSLICQIASNRDPHFASNRAPLNV